MAPAHRKLKLIDQFKLSAEEKLLVICSRLTLNPVQRNELEAIASGQLDWDWILRKARWHLFPLLYRHLQQLESVESVPPQIMEFLKTACITNVGRSLYFDSELKRVLNEFNAQKIPVIVLKGAVLAEKIYGRGSLRPMTDVDLLVHHDDTDRADSIVRSMGYIPSVDQETEEEMRERDRQLARLARAGRPVIFDIHSHIVERDNPLRFDISGFWERAVPTTIAGVPTLELAPEDFLTHLTMNFFKDLRFSNFAALGELCDISETIRHYEGSLDWDFLLQNSLSNRLNGPVFCGLCLASQVVGAAVPQTVLDQLEPSDFNSKDARLLVSQRVLGENWVAKELVEPWASYSWWKVTWGMLRRIFPSRRSLTEQSAAPSSTRGVILFYSRRLGEAMSIAVRSIVRPNTIRNDLMVDRWLHSLYGATKK